MLHLAESERQACTLLNFFRKLRIELTSLRYYYAARRWTNLRAAISVIVTALREKILTEAGTVMDSVRLARLQRKLEALNYDGDIDPKSANLAEKVMIRIDFYPLRPRLVRWYFQTCSDLPRLETS